MGAKNQLTGMQGVYLVAAELSGHGFIAAPTSRSARGADILVTDPDCKSSFSVQVKTNAASTPWWLLNQHAKDMVSDSHVYVLVILKKQGTEFFVVPSRVVSEKMCTEKHGSATWFSIEYKDVLPFKDHWEIFGKLK